MLKEITNFISVPGGKVWSQILYTDAIKNKTPLIILHGGPGSSHECLKYGLKSLVRSRPLIFYDQLGSKMSPLTETELTNTQLWQLPRFVEELQQVVNFYNPNDFHLFGTSWGASLALEYTLTQKPKPKSLILSSPLINTKMWLADANRLKNALPKNTIDILNACEQSGNIYSKEYQEAANVFYEKHIMQTHKLNHEQLAIFHNANQLFNNTAYNFMWGPTEFFVTGNLIDFDRYNELSQLTQPTLFICGEFDEATPNTVTLFHKQVAHSEFVMLNGCSHFGYFENPNLYTTTLQDFIDRND